MGETTPAMGFDKTTRRRRRPSNFIHIVAHFPGSQKKTESNVGKSSHSVLSVLFDILVQPWFSTFLNWWHALHQQKIWRHTSIQENLNFRKELKIHFKNNQIIKRTLRRNIILAGTGCETTLLGTIQIINQNGT